MTKQALTLNERLDRMDAPLERMATGIVKGFDTTQKQHETLRVEIKQSIDIYTRAVAAHAKQAEAYMQEMLAFGAKVGRPEKQIEQIAAYLNIKLAY